MSWEPTPHPILRLPTADDVRRIAEANGIDPQTAFVRTIRKREELIAREKENPLLYGWEPKSWKLADALLGLPFVDEGWAKQVREALGFVRPVRILLIMGGNRSGKSEYAAKRSVMLLLRKAEQKAWFFHSTSQMSIDWQQPLIFKYLPRELKAKDIRTKTTYVAYKAKTGFSEQSFILPNSSHGSFRYYEQATGTLEGGELDWTWPDELVPPEVVDTLFLRLATRDGKGVVTFTPIEGYSPTVRLFLDGAKAVSESVAYLCPKDEKDPREDLALEQEDFDRIVKGAPDGRLPADRKFETVPRVMRCVDEGKAVLYFHSSDNPYGNPKAVLDIIRTQPRWFKRERFYGIANKSTASRFPRFCDKHILKASQIPEKGTNYLIADPSSGRNFFMAWVRRTPEGIYFYRQWPGPYEIPGFGVLGSWAMPDGRKHDGRQGEGQRSIGFGLREYRDEIARLEGWKLDGKILRADQAKEKVFRRFLDSRFASAARLENDRPVTLLDQFERLGLIFETTPGDDINEGVAMVNEWLSFDNQKPMDFFNKPFMFVSDECPDIIYSLQNWTGLDGQKGACKDPADVVRYTALLDLEYVTKDVWDVKGGGSY